MKAQTALIGFVILASSSLCWAGSSNQTTGGQSLTREQVRAELEEARRQGLLMEGDVYPVEIPKTGRSKTRAEVLQELQEAREQGCCISMRANIRANFSVIRVRGKHVPKCCANLSKRAKTAPML
ncbi:MAG: DUF4148 domain-containing protein [Burkholderiales bacterium]|nr:DUF4148 domain-containing protein [Xanthomonadales bacterium]MBN9407324.1 DUF4148 domain-containing protein [Burkholderiales bacterium]